jgi:two-component system OmpR family sensor kinase
MSRRTRRLGVRSRLLLAVGAALALALVAGLVGFSLLLSRRLASDASALARAHAQVEEAALVVVDGKLAAPELPPEDRVAGQTWIFAGQRVLERPRANQRLQATAESLAGGPARSFTAHDSRFYALPVLRNGARYGTVVSAIPLDAYDETERTGFVASLVFSVALLAVGLVVTRWILGKALLPVSRMTEDASKWSDSDIDRRFDLGEPYDELTRLGATLDALLDRLASSLRHEQRLTAELSHELRTPLARIAAEAELALNRPREPDDYRASIEAIRRNADQMTRTIDALIAAARQDARLERTTSDARHAVELAVEAAREAADARNIEVRVAVPDAPLIVAVESDLLERIVQPVLDNAVRYGQTAVGVELGRNGASAVIAVADDGPGVDPDERDRIFEPGARGEAGRGTQGAGLGLALARRLARSAGGDVSVSDNHGGGAFAVKVPLA